MNDSSRVPVRETDVGVQNTGHILDIKLQFSVFQEFPPSEGRSRLSRALCGFCPASSQVPYSLSLRLITLTPPSSSMRASLTWDKSLTPCCRRRPHPTAPEPSSGDRGPSRSPESERHFDGVQMPYLTRASRLTCMILKPVVGEPTIQTRSSTRRDPYLPPLPISGSSQPFIVSPTGWRWQS